MRVGTTGTMQVLVCCNRRSFTTRFWFGRPPVTHRKKNDRIKDGLVALSWRRTATNFLARIKILQKQCSGWQDCGSRFTAHA